LFCIYRKNEIWNNNIFSSSLFKESRDGQRFPLFPCDKAIVHLDIDEKYRVESLKGEVIFIGCGLDQALNRIYHAQSGARIEIIAGGKRYSLDEYLAEVGSDEPT
jgi:hypothetical protein